MYGNLENPQKSFQFLRGTTHTLKLGKAAAGAPVAFWYCDICGGKAPTESGKDEPKYITGHHEIDAVTFGMIWSLHETYKVCDQA